MLGDCSKIRPVIILFTELVSGSISTNFTLFPIIGLPRICFLAVLAEIFLIAVK